MKLHVLSEGKMRGYATWGCMWEQGRCRKGTAFRCTGENGQEVPMQSRITALWPDGSIKWTAHTASSALLGREIEVLPAQTTMKAEQRLTVERQGKGFCIRNGSMALHIPGAGGVLFTSLERDGKPCMLSARPELMLEEPAMLQGQRVRIEKRYDGVIDEVALEECGDMQITVKYVGSHTGKDGERKLPFIIRMRVSAGEERIHLTHTFLYDGDENRDMLKALGIAFDMPMQGPAYNRHLKFAGDHGVFHEVVVGLTSWRPRLPAELYERQMLGETLRPSGDVQEKLDAVMQNVPYWSVYDVCQDSAEHYAIRKRLAPEHLCMIDAQHGRRAKGSLAFGSEGGSVLVAIRDFWEKYPSGYTVSGLDSDLATCHVWLWHPAAAVMDFRHYADRGYNQVCYEGYDYKGATPVGIACTNECVLMPMQALIPSDEAVLALAQETADPPHYVASPECYHELRAFGYWSLPSRETELERWLEEQLDRIFDFYDQEVSQRGWYGMFNYGDFMHTYDRVRHQWKYDVGGYAWDNTELVPTLWLWMYFLRTGRADAFRLAERLSRHASEVDVYHLGQYKGLGSRHNVRHWGCPCKEARIAMAHHHRCAYYLTGDLRLGDIFDELKDNELSFYAKDPLGDFYDRAAMVYPSHARSGPDWSSLCSNWLTQWERTGDTAYRDKLLTGMADIEAAPLRLISGPDFEFDPATVHLRYIGENTTGGTHLQICMGAPSIWMEMADLLDDDRWRAMMAEYGRFYFLPEEDKQRESRGLIGSREFSLPFMAAAMGAYAAAYRNDPETAKRTWAVLLHTLLDGENSEGFAESVLADAGNCESLREIPWISTNFAAQFGVNVIMALDFIRDQLPGTVREAQELVRDMDPWFFRKA